MELSVLCLNIYAYRLSNYRSEIIVIADNYMLSIIVTAPGDFYTLDYRYRYLELLCYELSLLLVLLFLTDAISAHKAMEGILFVPVVLKQLQWPPSVGCPHLEYKDAPVYRQNNNSVVLAVDR